MNQPNQSVGAFEQAVAQQGDVRYRLRLYVTGATPRSTLAIANARSICERYLYDRYDLEVIDVYQQPATLRDEQVVVAPTLVKLDPPPLKRLIGDLSDLERVLRGLGIFPTKPNLGEVPA
ncbi:MAG: circadian clock KaiB family protein [Armatimonadota bacterium]